MHECKNDIKRKEKVHIMNFSDKGKVNIMAFWESKKIFFNAGSWQKDGLSLVFTKLALCFMHLEK